MRKALALGLIWQMTCMPAVGRCEYIPGMAGKLAVLPVIEANTLPVPIGVASGLIEFDNPDDKTLVVRQDIEEGASTAKAVIDWASFNIGGNATTRFDQQGHSTWAILNRIHDRNPSQILGRLSADGRIYLINRNGILFGPDSQVNVHALVASTLNLSNEDFQDNALNFQYEDYAKPDGAAADAASVRIGVVNQGTIVATESGGRIFLLARDVENDGNINAFAGQVGLAAGTTITLREPNALDSTRLALGRYVDIESDPGTVVNSTTGVIVSDMGLTGMYGREVVQDGIIRATTAPEKASKIELLATDQVTLGAASWTATPIVESDEEYVGDNNPAAIVIQGITTGDTVADTGATVKRVEHYGAIDAPSGDVIINAGERVYLESGSSIDVSGIWVDLEAGANVLDAQLNSIELRDDFGQKNGILKGERIHFLANRGSAIGDVSGTIDSQGLTAAEQNVGGGTMSINVGVADPVGETRDIIVREGAELNFAGGGVAYGQGIRQTTKLLSGNRVYNIGDAPQWLEYAKILGEETVVHSRFGVVDTFTGFYSGGAVPLLNYGGAYIEGADAGTLTLVAPRVLLDGTLNGAALAGVYQIFDDPADVPDGVSGVLRPTGGTLQLGWKPTVSNPNDSKDAVLESAEIVAAQIPLENFSADELLEPDRANKFSAGILNEARLGQLVLQANTEIAMAGDASLYLQSGGSLDVSARRIVQQGQISVPGGDVLFALTDNLTSLEMLPGGGVNERYADLDGRFFLGDTGEIDVAGERIDNRYVGSSESLRNGLVEGGTVAVRDQSATNNVVLLAEGSRIDVSGGYVIDADGEVDGGAAGSLALNGDTLILDGGLQGKALLGEEAGSLTLHADRVEVAGALAEDPATVGLDDEIPEERQGLHLAADRFADTGFTHLDIQSVNDLNLTGAATLQPSLARLEVAENVNAFTSGVRIAKDGLPDPDDIGGTSITLKAGQSFEDAIPDLDGYDSRETNEEAVLQMDSSARVVVAPGGNIAVSGPQVQLDGTLYAPAGEIALKASYGDLILGPTAKVRATGWNRPDSQSTVADFAQSYTPLDGGMVEATASMGNFILTDGALIDVSAAPLTRKNVFDGYNRVSSVATAGNPGQVSIRVFGTAELAGSLAGRAAWNNGRGGSFRLNYTDIESSVQLADADFERIGGGGFDEAVWGTLGEFVLTGVIDAGFGRSLTLDAGLYTAGAAADVRFAAPWLRLLNTAAPFDGTVAVGDGRLILDGQWIDAVGDVNLSGFGDVILAADRDLRLSDYDYSVSGATSDNGWAGSLTVPEDLILEASRIVAQVPDDFVREFAAKLSSDGEFSPAFAADFTISAGGKITTLPGSYASVPAVVTAGGSLTLEAGGGIEHRGNLQAPLGSLTLSATGAGSGGRVFLGEGSRLVTSGSGSVQYGAVDNGTWFRTEKISGSRERYELTGAPEKSVVVEGEEVLVAEGATIDVSGGGTVFGYQFEPSIEGTENPLTGALVIVPDPDLVLPGQAIYIKGGDGIAEGVYSILPTEYAFRDDALMLSPLGTDYVAGSTGTTEEGYRIVGGYVTCQGTGIEEAVLQSYSLRRASDVLAEGHFTKVEAVAGNGGNITLEAPTTVVGGTFSASSLEGFSGGVATMSGEHVYVSGAAVPLPAEFDFDTALADELLGTLYIDGAAVSGQGFAEIHLGDLSITKTLTLEQGSRLEAEKVALSGGEKILLKSGSRIDAVSDRGEGEIELRSPSGRVVLEEGAVAHASDGLTLATNDLTLQGDFEIDNSALTLAGEKIVFVQGETVPAEAGLFITEKFWSLFSNFENIGLESSTDTIFRGDFSLEIVDSLSIDTARLAVEGGSVELTADQIVLSNSSGNLSSDQTLDDTGTLALNAETIELGPGTVVVDGVDQVNLGSTDGDRVATSEVFLRGQGGLTTDGDLIVTAGRVAVTGYRGADDVYQAADFTIDAGAGTVTIAGNGGEAEEAGDGGGQFTITAGTIHTSGGIIDNTAGATVLNAGDSIRVDGGSRILARGTDSLAAGTVELHAQSGSIELAAGSVVDVSAGIQGDAGSVGLSAAVGGATIDGELRGAKGSEDGRGGSFDLDAASVADFAGINRKLVAGGFDESIAVRARSGDLTVSDTVTAREIHMAADEGELTLSGTLDAGGASTGGDVELHAGRDVVLADDSRIDASGTERGGSVLLNSSDGRVRMASGATIDVAGTEGGTVHFRADRETATSGINMELQGTVSGASEIVAEGVQNYTTAAPTLSATTYLAEAGTYMTNAAAMETALLGNLDLDGGSDELLHLRPGIEVEASGDLTVPALSLTTARYNGEPGILRVRTPGNLTVSGKVIDTPTAISSLNSTTARDSWGLALVAGADVDAADPTATRQGQGNLTVNAGAQVYSESGAVTLASGNDLTIGKGTTGYLVASAIPLSVGSYAGDVSLRAGHDLILNGGVIQTATGDIEVDAGGDVDLNYSGSDMGTIRTLGEAQGKLTDYWNYANGGAIDLKVGGSINGFFNRKDAWDNIYGARHPKSWGAKYSGTNTTQGIATLAGGDLNIEAAGDITAQAGTFGSGDLSVSSGGDLSGRFLNRDGRAEFQALGNVGGAAEAQRSVFEIFDADLQVTGQGDLKVAAVVDPLITNSSFNKNTITWTTGYTTETSVNLTSLAGDVALYGDSPFYNEKTTTYSDRERVLPATVTISAGRDILLNNKGSFSLLPAADGNLSLIAGNDILGIYENKSFTRIIMNDGDPTQIYGASAEVPADLFEMTTTVRSSLLHEGDADPVVISAGGDIEYLGLRLVKAANISAGGDIRYIQYIGQNLAGGDVSRIYAGKDIEVESGLTDLDNFGIEQGGPGTLLVQAGNSLDLGSSDGIETYGSTVNTALGDKGSDLVVIAGYTQELELEQLADFFSRLKVYGENYSLALAGGNDAEAAAIIAEARETLIVPALGAGPTNEERQTGKGNIDMIQSLIRTSGGVDDIFIIAAGDANVGRTAIGDSSDTGIVTTAGGGISIFLVGDLNVNESRMMTFRGGDMLVWSDRGDINAGRGSGSAISSPNSIVRNNVETGELEVVYSPPMIGSGIRGLSYDPDGVSGPLSKPDYGDITLIAPGGIIDAGEAGIAGGRIILGATEVLNSQNISFSFGSVGVPAASDSAGGLGALAGVSNLNESSSLLEQAGSFGPRESMSPSQVVDSFIEKWIDVEVIGFDI